MIKAAQVTAIALIAFIAISRGSPARLDKVRSSKSKVLSRQVTSEAIPTQTPYPPAGIRPEVPFNLPTEEKLIVPARNYLPPILEAAEFNAPQLQVYGPPDEVYEPPAETYGPPEVSEVKDEVDEVAETEQSTKVHPEGTEENEINTPAEEDTDDIEVTTIATEIEEKTIVPDQINVIPLRLVAGGRANGQLRSANLQAAPLRSIAQPIYLADGSVFAYKGQLFRL